MLRLRMTTCTSSFSRTPSTAFGGLGVVCNASYIPDIYDKTKHIADRPHLRRLFVKANTLLRRNYHKLRPEQSSFIPSI